jgi:hypothetical protein
MNTKLTPTRIATCILFALASLPLAGYSQPVSLRAAELLTRTNGEGKLWIYLNKHYDCGQEPLAEKETVSLQQAETNMIFQNLDLSIDSIYEQRADLSGLPPNSHPGCVKTVRYAASIDASFLGRGMDITWGYYFARPVYGNAEDRGISLTVRVTGQDLAMVNTMPSFRDLPLYVIKSQRSSQLSLQMQDADGDSVRLSFSLPFSLQSTSGISYDQDDARLYLTDLKKPQYFNYEGSLLTDKAPFLPVKPLAPFSDKNPLGAQTWNWDPQQGVIRYELNRQGKFITAINLAELRNHRVLSQHQALIIFDIL